MTESKKSEVNPWLIVAVLAVGYLLWTRQPAPSPTPDNNTVASIDATIKQVKADQLKALAKSFDDAANQVEAGKFKYARELLEYMQPITKSAREQANKPFDLMIGQMIPDELVGKEKQVADDLRKVAKAWLK